MGGYIIKFINQLSLFIILLLFFQIEGYAKSSSTSGAIILRMPIDARNVSLGNSGAGVAGFANSLENNPAVLAYLNRINLSMSHISILSDLQMNSLLYSEPFGKNKSFSFFAKMLKSDEIERTDFISWNQYIKTGTFNIKDVAAGLSFAHKSDRPLDLFGKSVTASYGISLKYLKSQIAEYKADAVAADAGLFFQNIMSPVSFGISVLNCGNNLKYISEGDKLPLTLKAGFAYCNTELSPIMVCGDIILLRNAPIEFTIGIEYQLSNYFSIRTGFDSRNDIDVGYSAGFGVSMPLTNKKTSLLNIEYAYKPFEDLGDYHYFTLTLLY
ncbi:PorV/PorQ family protein [Candidatus Dependentiae bacterium]|nr:PorV/PorQ family protein [Candidatus Dependentiae bacterium]